MEKFGKVLAIIVNSLLGASLIIELANRFRARKKTVTVAPETEKDPLEE